MVPVWYLDFNYVKNLFFSFCCFVGGGAVVSVVVMLYSTVPKAMTIEI